MCPNLPFHILTTIFFFARDGNDSKEFDTGAELVKWDSTCSARPFTLVCRGWHDAANFVLFRSVAIIGEEGATLFLDVLKAHPERPFGVSFLVLGLTCDGEADPSSQEAKRASDLVLDVLEACTSVAHLHIRPLHPSTRPRLLSTLRSRPLESLICSPRLATDEHAYFRAADLQKLVSPELERLDLDFWVDPLWPPARHPPSFRPLALVDVRLFCTGADPVVLALLKAAGPTLRTIHVYFENMPNAIDAADALLPSTPTLQELTYITNPASGSLDDHFDPSTPQLFSRILPHFQHLESLTTCATEVSTDLFRILPQSLRRIELSSFYHSPAFRFEERILDDIEAFSVHTRLEEFVLHDEGWHESEVEALGDALRSRGITLTFTDDGGGLI